MRYQHFEHFAPICPLCRRDQGTSVPLDLHVSDGNLEWIEEGHFHCPRCQAIYPVLRGIPILVPNIGKYLEQSYIHTMWNTHFSAHHLQWLSEAAGPNSMLDNTRNYLSTYMWCHYGDLEPEPDSKHSNLLNILDSCKQETLPEGNLLDLGCAVGRSTFWLAEQYNRPVLGLDLNFAMLLHGQEVMRKGRVVYGQREVGTVYRWKEYETKFANTELIDFWVADAMALPLSDDSIGSAISLNVMDCTTSPMAYLAELNRVAKEFHSFCPYDWSTAITEFHEWIGGHNSFAEWKGRPEKILRYLFSENSPHPDFQKSKIIHEIEEIPWRIRVHDRSMMEYLLHYIRVSSGISQSNT